MNKIIHYINRSICPAPRMASFAVALLSIGLAGDALAQPGYAQNVMDQCGSAGRPSPNFGSYECATCHTGNAGAESKSNLSAKGNAYRAGNIVDTFCPNSKKQTPISSNDTAPVFNPIATPIIAVVGQPLVLPVLATDPQGDRLKLSAKKLPAKAKFKNLGQVDGEWAGVLNWKPSKKQAGKTFHVDFVAKEKGRNPSLQVALTVDIQVQ